MKTNRNSTSNNKFSLAGERINAYIERDIALIFIIMAVGLLFRNDSGLRGFPLGWLYPGREMNFLSSPGNFFISLAASAAIVIVCEIINLSVRKLTEKTAFPGNSLNSGSDPVVYANTYDDSEEFTDELHEINVNKQPQKAIGSSLKKVKLPDLPLNNENNPILQALNKRPAVKSASGSSSSFRRAGNAGSNTALTGVFVLISVIVIFFIGTTISVLSPDIDSVEEEYYGDDFESSAFFTDEDFLSDECSYAFSLLDTGNIEELSSLNGGSAKALVDMADWSSYSYTEEARNMSEYDPNEGFIRFAVETDNSGDFIVAFKFEGEGMNNDESAANLVGIAACPRSVLDEYDNVEDWDSFAKEVDNNMKYVGDVHFMGESILTW